jgi:hypothetical protein
VPPPDGPLPSALGNDVALKKSLLFIAPVLGYVFIVYTGLRTNFIPHGVNGLYVIAIASALGLASLRFVWQHRFTALSLTNQRWLRFYLWLLAFILWAPLIGVIPAFSTFAISEPYAGQLTVLKKTLPAGRSNCYKIETKEYEELFASQLCTTAQIWKSLEPAQKIRVTGVENRFGFRVDEISIP